MKFDKTFSEDKKLLFMYVCSLVEAGADYIEVDFEAVMKLPKPSGAEKYIFRLSRPEEFVVANTLNFSYAVLPLRFSYVQQKLEIPVILEVETGDSDVFDVLQVVSANIDLSQYSMIRIIGEFEPDTIPAIISTYRRRTIIPLDICPSNAGLTALTSAISAFNAKSDAITVKFGDYRDYASLEEVLIMLASMHKIIVNQDYLEGICKASLFWTMCTTETERSNLMLMMQKYMHGPLKIENVDVLVDDNEAQIKQLLGSRIRAATPNLNTTPTARVLSSLGIDRETSNKIIEILENCSMDIFKVPSGD